MQVSPPSVYQRLASQSCWSGAGKRTISSRTRMVPRTMYGPRVAPDSSTMTVPVSCTMLHWLVHHLQHPHATTVAEIAPDEDGREAKEPDVEDGRVVESHRRLDHLGIALLRDKFEAGEDELD